MNMLVTGSVGFIGSYPMDTLMLRGFDVCVLDNLSKGTLESVGHRKKIHVSCSSKATY